MDEDKSKTNGGLRDTLDEGLLKVDLTDFAKIGEDALELGIDILLEEGILKDIPIVGTVAKLHSASSKLNTYRTQRNVLHFFQEYAKNKIDEPKRLQFLTKFQRDPKYRQKVLDVVLISMGQFSDAIQARVLANLIAAHIKGAIDFSQLCACEFALERLNPTAYEYLHQLSENETPFTTHHRHSDQEALLYSAGIASRHGTKLSVSQIGQDLFIHGIMPCTSSTLKMSSNGGKR
jgi:hypothetical protein